ncbi:CHAP domain-containing protein [Thomasclavelia cocleata]|jgi:hypothetical protein|uniref:CHAP domain-containing protein n=1 Tax=Thomasclavelia cocleata TaxID=69824 RepID=UPI00242E1C28|nr:CHAP domain-containing protein [Thomasclavelia cocleata]
MKKKWIGISLTGFLMPGSLILLCLCFLIAVASFDTNTSSNNSSDLGNTLETFCQIAENEFLIVNGATGGDKYRKWYTGEADGANWCATFVSWVADQAGILDISIPKYQSCDAGVEWFKQRQQFQYTSAYGGTNYIPKRGDIVFFCKGDKKDSTHTGIVIKYENDTITTIEGNSSNTIKKKNYSIANTKKTILGFASPSYPSLGSDGTTGFLSEAFKFFAIGESGKNYDKGFSSSDGYHALGYYQFDNRYDLQDFLNYCYNTDSALYAEFESFLKIKKSKLANNRKLENAWHTVYKKNPSSFAILQDQFEYNNYYIPVEAELKKKGIDISNRADVVKGMCCSFSNWSGTVTASKIIIDSKVKSSMTDKQFVSKVYDYMYSLKYEDYKKYGKTGKKYYNGWHNRWKTEKVTCLSYF